MKHYSDEGIHVLQTFSSKLVMAANTLLTMGEGEYSEELR